MYQRVGLALCAVLASFAGAAFQADGSGSDLSWFIDLAKANNGKAFCAPPSTKIKDLSATVAEFANDHPELHGRINEDQTLRALAERFPCAAASAADSPPAAVHPKGESLMTVTPIFSQLLAAALPKGFQSTPVYEATLPGPRYLRETVPDGESDKEWSQMITITGVKELAVKAQVTPRQFVESMADGYQKACPASFSNVSVPTGKIGNYDAYSVIVSCGASPLTAGRTSEAAMILAIRGRRDFYTVQWAERATASAVPLAIDTARWIRRFKALAPIKVCDIVAGESAPYPSCVD